VAIRDTQPGPADVNAIHRLVSEHPFAWVVSGGERLRATPLPLRPLIGPSGAVTHLVGHFARSNPHVEALKQDPRALILLLGPHGYVSPSWFTDRAQAPTWNYASTQFLAEIAFVEDDADILHLLQDLVSAMEAGRPNAWRIDELGPRYKLLSRRIIGFRARVLEARPAFKLGQDERGDTFSEILAGLGEGSALGGWMAWLGRATAASST
jgi:predicted FMN-binding regulatory protein PaiB